MIETRIHNIIVITSYNLLLKEGAAYSRILSYQKAVAPDFRFYILNSKMRGSEICDFIREADNHAFEERSYIYRIFLELFDFITPIIGIKKIKSNFEKEKTSILIYSSNFLQAFLSVIGLRFFLGYKVIFEKNESEIGIQLNIERPRGWALFLFTFLYPFKIIFALFLDLVPILCNQIIVISTRLERKYSICKKKISLIPILVDTSMFRESNLDYSQKVRFIYMGSLTIKKDNILEIVNSINRLSDKDKQRLVFDFIGSGNKKVIAKISSKIESYRLNDIITIKPSIPSSKVPEVLSNYNGAISIRERNIQTNNGFSTKLGEYLAAGLIVICNPISDINKYLVHKQNCLICEKENITQMLSFAINNDNGEMQRQARYVARSNFDCYLYQELLFKIIS